MSGILKDITILREVVMSNLSPEAIKVRNALVEKGIETPMIDLMQDKDQRRQGIEQHMREVIKLIGLDLSDDSLKKHRHVYQKCLLMRF